MRSALGLAILLALVPLGALATITAARPADQTAASPLDDARGRPFDGLHFRDIGPAATGGRIHDIQIDPTTPAVLYVAAATGGI
jgi:hypothetical protein